MYSIVRNKAIHPFLTTRIDLEDIMLSEVSQIKTNTVGHNLRVHLRKPNS